MWLLLDTGALGTWLRLNEIWRLDPNATDLLSSWEEEGSPHLFLHAVTVERQWGTWQEGGLSTEKVPSEPNHADTLILGVQPPEPWEKQIPVCGICVTVQAEWHPGLLSASVYQSFRYHVSPGIWLSVHIYRHKVFSMFDFYVSICNYTFFIIYIRT